MPISRMRCLAALLAIPFLAACQNKMYNENIALHAQNQELQKQLNESQSQIADRDQHITELEKDLNDNHAAAPAAAPETIAPQVEVHRDAAAGTVTVNVPGDILFSSGRATINASAKGTLERIVAAIKKDYAGKSMRIEGHTDSDPIVYSAWKNNLDLSEARAKAVAHYLVKEGVPTALITTSGYGDTRPKGEDKARNRRVDIVILSS